MTISTKADVRSAAELERRRLARQAAESIAAAESQARAAETETTEQARLAQLDIEQQAKAARQQAEEEAATTQAQIRKDQGQTEAESQAIISKARAYRAKELRKIDLPSSHPQTLGIQEYIDTVEAIRKEAHKAGRYARADVSKIRDAYFKDVDKWATESKASVGKQLEGIQAEIAKSLVDAKAEITKQQADLKSGIDDWEAKAKADIEDFESSNTKLDTGEWVDTATFDKLPPDYQALLKTVGVDDFNTRVEREVQEFESKHIEIKPELWVDKTEWAGLTPNQQKEVIETGTYTTIPTADQAFDQLKAEGKIPDNAILKSYDQDTGELTYTALKTNLSMPEIMEYWNKLNADQQQIQINGALGKNVRTHYKDYDELTKDEKNAVIEYYTQSALPFQTNDTQFFKDLWEEQKAQLKDAAIGMIPIYGTIYNWDRMSPTWRGISIALDIATIVPLIKAAGQGIKSITLGIRTRLAPVKTAATTLAKAEAAMADDMAKILKQAYSTPSNIPGVTISNTKLANSYTSMIKAQGKYLKALGQQADLLAKGKVVPAKLKTAIVGYESKLRIAASDFVNKLYGSNSQLRGVKNVPVRFDSPEVARLMNSLPTEMVQNSKAAIAGIQAKTTSIKALTAAVGKAEAALKAAQAKWPTAPSKWVDLMYELSQAQGKLAAAKTGSVQNLYQELIKARNAGKGVEAARLQQQLDQAVKSMEIEYGRLGFNTGGNIGIADIKPLSPSYSPTRTPTVGPKISVNKAAIAAVKILSTANAQEVAEWATPGGTSTPEVIAAATAVARTLPKVTGVTDTEVIELTEAALRQSIKSSLEGKTIEEIKTDTLNAIEPITDQWIETEQVTKTEAKAITSTAVTTAVKTATELKITNKLKTSHDIPGVTSPAKDGVYPDGTIVWNMGETKRGDEYKVIPPPYTLTKPISSNNPPKGMKKTKGTPQETLTFIGGKVPFKNVSFDLGITDGFIDVKAKTIKFSGEGEQTDVGKRQTSTTTGISLTDNPPLLQQLTRPKGRRGRGNQMAKNATLSSVRTPRNRRPVSHGVYTDRAGTRITRKRKRHWKRIY